MKLIVGLGNPGDRYQNSRHNVGFWAVDELSQKWGVSFKRKPKLECWLGEGEISSNPVLLVKPTTFMNGSGRAFLGCLEFFKLSHQETLVILDDIFLKLGQIRFRTKGSAGGHKGLQSIVEACQSTEIPRLRLGVGLPAIQGEGWVDHVLGAFSRHELENARGMTLIAADVANAFVMGGSEMVQKFLSDVQSKSKVKS